MTYGLCHVCCGSHEEQDALRGKQEALEREAHRFKVLSKLTKEDQEIRSL